ncbi:MAG: isopeptide-forming domain-containing fimbrial protein [Ruminococcus sp.]|nr:isopeptide-forming domain-containing fimbrial protein [Ruminococcus sp.]
MKKTNRTFKRFAAITSASLLAACAVMPAVSSAANITITKGDASIPFASHTFEAYQIFKGDLDEKTNTLTNITWGSNINSSVFINNLQFNATDLGISSIADGASAAAVAEVLADITAADNAKLLAKIVNDSLKPVDDAAPATSSNGVIENLATGYYFVKDAENSGTDSGDAKTRFILKVTDDETVEIKTDAPSLVKKIKHNETDEWGDVGDNQIGDTVEYYIATTVPDISDYDTYKYIIRDDMEAGLTYSGVTKIEYQPATAGSTATTLWDGTGTPSNITITAADDSSTVDFVEDFYINFDLKSLNLAAGGTIYTYYSAVLNGGAEVSSGADDDKHNDNTAYLTYSNNPNQSGSGNTHSTNDTEEDTVYDWTYTFDASKVDGSLADKPALAGAKFSLYEGDSETAMSLVSAGTAGGIDYYRIATADDADEDKITVITTSTTEGRLATFRILGLDDDQKYVIKEIATPSAEYNKCPDVVINKLTATYDTVGTDLTALTASITQGTNENANASNSVIIENNKGSVLPGTGGIGTTIFYLGGGAMAAIGGVYLISKRRMKKSEE